MKLPRRKFLHLAAGAAALPAVSHFAWAQAYPTRPVRLILGWPAGGTTDIGARLVAQWLSERLGQPFVVENRPGAGTHAATEAVVRARADGYTLLMATGSNAINATLYDKLNYTFINDMAPVAGVLRSPFILEIHPAIPAKTVSELITYAKANPGKLNMASFWYWRCQSPLWRVVRSITYPRRLDISEQASCAHFLSALESHG